MISVIILHIWCQKPLRYPANTRPLRYLLKQRAICSPQGTPPSAKTAWILPAADAQSSEAKAAQCQHKDTPCFSNSWAQHVLISQVWYSCYVNTNAHNPFIPNEKMPVCYLSLNARLLQGRPPAFCLPVDPGVVSGEDAFCTVAFSFL